MGDVVSAVEILVAEQRARTSTLDTLLGVTSSSLSDLDVLAADLRFRSSLLDAHVSGSSYLYGTLRVLVGLGGSLWSDCACVVADAITDTLALSINITDSFGIVIEPNDPRDAPIVEAFDFETGVHPNAIKSATIDFGAIGVSVGDVFEVTSVGVNRGNYIIVAVQANVLFVAQAFRLAEQNLCGQVRRNRDMFAYPTAALVLDQPVFNNGFAVAASLQILIS